MGRTRAGSSKAGNDSAPRHGRRPQPNAPCRIAALPAFSASSSELTSPGADGRSSVVHERFRTVTLNSHLLLPPQSPSQIAAESVWWWLGCSADLDVDQTGLNARPRARAS